MNTLSSRPHPRTLARLAALAVPAVLGGAGSAAMAVEYGSVISSTPVNAQVGTPQQQCVDEQQLVQQRPSGGGAVVGAVIGGVLGNTIGAGLGRAAATGIGAVVGAGVGDNVEAASTPPAAINTRRCSTVTRYDNRVVGYDVVYEYQGQRYVTRVAQPPGERIALNVSVTPADGALPTGQPADAGSVSTVVEPAGTSTAYPAGGVYPAPYPAPTVYPAPAYYPYGSYGYGYGYYPGVVAPRVVIGVGGYWGHGYYGHGRRWR